MMCKCAHCIGILTSWYYILFFSLRVMSTHVVKDLTGDFVHKNNSGSTAFMRLFDLFPKGQFQSW